MGIPVPDPMTGRDLRLPERTAAGAGGVLPK